MSEPQKLPEVVLKEVADYIERHGHCQDRLDGVGAKGEVCALMGIRAVTGLITVHQSPAYQLLRDRIRSRQVATWNDTTPTAEVLRVLRGEP